MDLVRPEMSWGEIAFAVYFGGIIFIAGTMVGACATEQEIPSWEEVGQMVTVAILWPCVIPTVLLLSWFGA